MLTPAELALRYDAALIPIAAIRQPDGLRFAVQVGEPVAGLPAVDARGQGGLLDVIVGPGFAQDRMIY